jgi:endonuclease/exonuclease/phosphatase family metal-dependent hydrolase
MRIVTLNTWKNEGDYPRRLGPMAAQLRELAPDVVCLQECFAADGAHTVGHLARELRMLAAAVPARRKHRLHQGRSVASSSGLAILSRRRPLAHAALTLSSDDRDGERVALRVDFEGVHGALRVLNLHLTHLRGASGAELRARQIDEALAWARADWAGALLVCGDLNCGRGDREFAALEAAAGEDLGSTLNAGRASDEAGRAIDHGLLVDPCGFAVRRRFVALEAPDGDGGLPSDHAAVVVDLGGA